MSTLLPKDVNKYKVSRRGGRKLQVSEDSRTLLALPKDIPERTWAELLQREENEIVCFEIREDIVEDALLEGYERYMERQTSLFTVHCAAKAWLRLIDWHFYRHDPGEDPSAAPPCYIPKRAESWIPDELPAPCVKDSWGRQELDIVEDCPDDPVQVRSQTDIEMSVVEPVPQEYWFPGRVNLTVDYVSVSGERKRHLVAEDSMLPKVELMPDENWRWNLVELPSMSLDASSTPSKICTESEVLQKVTDYGGDEQTSTQEESHLSLSKSSSPSGTTAGSLQGAGDSTLTPLNNRRSTGIGRSRIRGSYTRSRTFSRHSLSRTGLETQFELSSESLIPTQELPKRK